MGIGAGIFLLAVGGILAFAVSDRISGVDLTMVGYILMGAGALGLVLVLLLNSQRSRSSNTTVVEERRDPGDPRF
jgi:nitrate/nitrite transporter NarK